MEIKASIPGWPDYMITDTGTVLSYKGKGRVERVLKVHDGRVSLRRDGRTHNQSVRSLMRLTFWRTPERTRCNRGHPYNENTRHCRKCHAARMARYRAKKRATATGSG